MYYLVTIFLVSLYSVKKNTISDKSLSLQCTTHDNLKGIIPNSLNFIPL